MSNRTMLEINHDMVPFDYNDLRVWVRQIRDYMRSGDPADLPRGVTWYGMRHHSEPCPIKRPPEIPITNQNLETDV